MSEARRKLHSGNGFICFSHQSFVASKLKHGLRCKECEMRLLGGINRKVSLCGNFAVKEGGRLVSRKSGMLASSFFCF